jgi:2-methylcitrate dehydratase PrpD
MRQESTSELPVKPGSAMLTRRNLFEFAGLAIASAALPSGLNAARTFTGQDQPVPSQGISPVMEKLSSYMSDAASRALPEEVIEKAKHHVLDTFAAMISGSELAPGRGALQFARAYGGKEVATVVASRIVCGPIEAAFANGVLAHSDETDDSHGPSRSHPGVSVVPAALAAGEHFGINGEHFLRAVTLGYDVGPRITMSMGGPSYQAATHRSTHGTVAVFAAGAAAGCAAGLSKQQMRFLLDYTAQQTSGIGAWARDAEHMEKAFLFAGKPAAGAVTTAILLHSGWTGVDDIFSGSDNFFDAYAPRENGVLKADPTQLVEKLGERYEITRTNIKKWTVGSPIQAPLDALVGFFQKRAFMAEDVEKVVVRVATDEANTVSNRYIRFRARQSTHEGSRRPPAARQGPGIGRSPHRRSPSSPRSHRRTYAQRWNTAKRLDPRRPRHRRESHDARGGCQQSSRPDQPGLGSCYLLRSHQQSSLTRESPRYS